MADDIAESDWYLNKVTVMSKGWLKIKCFKSVFKFAKMKQHGYRTGGDSKTQQNITQPDP